MSLFDEYAWMTVGPERIYLGDTVRVLGDAFPSPTGDWHNGRIGVVTAKEDGDIIVASIDNRKPALSSAHYPFYKLEKWVECSQ